MKSLFLKIDYNKGIVFDGPDAGVVADAISRAVKVDTDYSMSNFIISKDQKFELVSDNFEIKPYEEDADKDADKDDVPF